MFPQAINTDKTLKGSVLTGGTKMLAYSDLIAPIIQAIKEFHDLWSKDHDRLENLDRENTELRKALCARDRNYSFCNK